MKTSTLIESVLLKNGPCTVRDLSLALGVSKADIRYNLKPLKHANKIDEIPPATYTLNRGRPASRFIIVNQLSVNHLEHLLNLVLTRLLDKKAPGEIADDLVTIIFNNDEPLFSQLSRINKAIEFFSSIGVLASWTAGKNGPQMTITNNPYKKEDPQSLEIIVDLLIERIINYVSKT